MTTDPNLVRRGLSLSVPEPAPATYAWIIDHDHIADESQPAPSNQNAVGVVGPRNAPPGLVDALRRGGGDRFRMYDGDGELYYAGRIVYADPDGPEDCSDFGPLDDFGMPNAGASEIRYQYTRGGPWETL